MNIIDNVFEDKTTRVFRGVVVFDVLVPGRIFLAPEKKTILKEKLRRNEPTLTPERVIRRGDTMIGGT